MFPHKHYFIWSSWHSCEARRQIVSHFISENQIHRGPESCQSTFTGSQQRHGLTPQPSTTPSSFSHGEHPHHRVIGKCGRAQQVSFAVLCWAFPTRALFRRTHYADLIILSGRNVLRGNRTLNLRIRRRGFRPFANG